jgi:L-ribulose-5-phosphate 3-epimerase
MRYAAMDLSLAGDRPAAPAILAAAREAGMDGVEFCLYADYAGDPLWSIEGAWAVADAAAAGGLDIPSLTLLMLNQGSFAGDTETRSRARAIVRHGIEVAQALGARIMLLPFFGAGQITGPAAIAQVVEDLREVAPAAKAAGVLLGLETTLPATATIDIIRAAGSTAVTAYFDVANAVWLNYDPIAEMQALHEAGALYQIHIKDIQEKPGDRAPGEGRVPYPAVAAALRRLGYDGYLVFETAATSTPVAAIRRHRAFIAELLGE